MGEPATTHFYSIVGISKTMCRSYCKSLLMRWHPDKKLLATPDPNQKGMDDKKEGVNVNGSGEPIISSPEGSSHHSHRSDEGGGLFSVPSILLRSLSRKTRTPLTSPKPQNATKNQIIGTATSPTSCSTSGGNHADGSCSKLKPSPLETQPAEIPTFTRSISRMTSSNTPIIFSQSTPRKKAPPIEKKLECTLEELSQGCVKQIMISRDVIIDGIIEQAGELVNISIKPGWKKGTKIKFEGKGDEKPGYQAADLVFLVDEKPHRLFTREGDDLVYEAEIPLVQALTGCTISVPLLGGDADERMSLSFDDVIHPGYVKVIKGQGMPHPKEVGKRGDLRINLLINFPSHLSHEQRCQAVDILQQCSE